MARKRSSQKNSKAPAAKTEVVVMKVPTTKVATHYKTNQGKGKKEKKFVQEQMQSVKSQAEKLMAVKEGVPIKVVNKVNNGSEIYNGAIPEENIISGDLQSVIGMAQLFALYIAEKRPLLITYDLASPTIGIYPTNLVAYLMLAFVRMAVKHKLLSGSLNAVNLINSFADNLYVPTGWAKYLEYLFEYRGAIGLAKRFKIDSDFTATNTGINGSPTLIGTTLDQPHFPSSAGFDNFALFQQYVSANTSTGDIVYRNNATVLNCFTGSNPFAGQTDLLNIISDSLRQSKDIGTVAFGEIGMLAPDASSFVYFLSNDPTCTDLTCAVSMQCPAQFDVDMAIILNLCVNPLNQVGVYFSLPITKCAPMPSWTSYVSNSGSYAPIITGTVISQIAAWYIWLSLRNQYKLGPIFGKRGWKLCGRKVPRFCSWIPVQINYAGIMYYLHKWLVKFAASAVSFTPEYSLDNYASIIFAFDALLARKVNDTGNVDLLNGTGACATLCPQSLFPPVTVRECDVILAFKAILDQIGPVFANGQVYIPSMAYNNNQYLATDILASVIKYPKYGFVNDNGPNQATRFGNQLARSFPQISMNNPSVDHNLTPIANFGPVVNTGSVSNITSEVTGNNTQAQIWASGYQVQTYNSYVQAAVIAKNGSYDANNIFWFNQATQLVQAANSLFGVSQINRRTLSSTSNYNTPGGPSMLGVAIYELESTSSTYEQFDFPYNNFSNASAADPTVNTLTRSMNYNFAYLLSRIQYYAPLAGAEMTMSLAFPVTGVYHLNSIAPVSQAYTTNYVQDFPDNRANPIVDSITDSMTQVDGPIPDEFVKEAAMNHTGKSAGSHFTNIKDESKDCLRKPLISWADRIAGTVFNRVTPSHVRTGCNIVGNLLKVPGSQLGCALVGKVYKDVRSYYNHYKNQNELKAK